MIQSGLGVDPGCESANTPGRSNHTIELIEQFYSLEGDLARTKYDVSWRYGT